MAYLVSITIYAFIYFGSNKLELRDGGIWYSNSTIVWENITAYDWLDNRRPLLSIEYINAVKTDLKLEIAIAPDEKERIDRILQLKL